MEIEEEGEGLSEEKCTLLVGVGRLVALIVALVLMDGGLVAEETIVADLGIRVCLVTHSDMINMYKSNMPPVIK